MVVWLEDAGTYDSEQLGSKAAWLGELDDRGMNVPNGFVIERDSFGTFLDENGIRGTIRRMIRQADGADREQKKRLSQRIDQVVMDADLPSSLRDRIEDAYGEIHVSKGIRNAGGRAMDLIDSQRGTGPVAVRASVDEPLSSIVPGEIGVNTVDEVLKAVKEVWARYLSPLAAGSVDDIDTVIEGVPVLVQNLVEADASVSVIIDDRDDGVVRVEGYPGIGTLMRDGDVRPDVWMIDREEGTILSRSIADKARVVRKDPQNGRFGERPVPSHKREEPSVSNEQLAEVVNMALSAKRQVGGAVRVGVAIRGGAEFVTTALSIEGMIVNDGEGGTVSTSREKRSGAVSEEVMDEDTLLVGDVSLESALSDGAVGLVIDGAALGSRLVTGTALSGRPVLLGDSDLVGSLRSRSHVTVDFGMHSVAEERGGDRDEKSYAKREAVTATDVYVMDVHTGDDSFLDSMLSSSGSGYVSSSCDGEIMTAPEQCGVGDWFVITDYGDVFDAAARDMKADLVLVDVDELVSEHGRAAVCSLFERFPELFETRFGVFFREVDEGLCEAAVRAGASVVASPEEIHEDVVFAVERSERSLLLDGVRRLL